jgi:hypothetical protein
MHTTRPIPTTAVTKALMFAGVLLLLAPFGPFAAVTAHAQGKLEAIQSVQAPLRPEMRIPRPVPLIPVESAQVSEVPSFRWANEELYYSIRLNGVEAMRGVVRAGQPRISNNRAYVPISGTARSMGFFNSVYPLDDRANTFMNPVSHLPWRSEKLFDEKGTIRGYNVTYQHGGFEARVERRHNERVSNFTAPIPGETHDMLTWTYALRARERLELGDKFSYYIYDGWVLSRLDLEVVDREDVYTPMGWFKAWKVNFSREIMGTRAGPMRNNVRTEPIVRIREPARHTGSFWVSRDENHIPIKVAINTFLGVGEAVIIRYKPANQ